MHLRLGAAWVPLLRYGAASGLIFADIDTAGAVPGGHPGTAPADVSRARRPAARTTATVSAAVRPGSGGSQFGGVRLTKAPQLFGQAGFPPVPGSGATTHVVWAISPLRLRTVT